MQHKETQMKNQFSGVGQQMVNPFGNSMQKIMELNIRTVQNISYMKPTDLFSSKPKEMMEKPMETFIHNSEVLLNYMTEAFNILGGQWLKNAPNLTQNANKLMNEASTVMEKNVKKATSLAKSATPTGRKSTTKKNKDELKSTTSSTKDKNQTMKGKDQGTKDKVQDTKGKDQITKHTSIDKPQSNTLHVKPTAQQLSQQGVGSFNKNGSMANKSNIGDWGHN